MTFSTSAYAGTAQVACFTTVRLTATTGKGEEAGHRWRPTSIPLMSERHFLFLQSRGCSRCAKQALPMRDKDIGGTPRGRCRNTTRKKALPSQQRLLSCDSRGIQTHNLLIRSQMLYSVELGSRPFLKSCAKVQRFFCNQQFFFEIFFGKLQKYCFSNPSPAIGRWKAVIGEVVLRHIFVRISLFMHRDVPNNA